IGYSTLTYLAAEPALSHSPEGEPAKAMIKSSASAQSQTPLCEPESGVKLLMSIFSRLGDKREAIAMAQDEESNRWAYKPNVWGSKKASRNENGPADQFAQQAPAKPSQEQQLSQALNSNVADPALSIRPQVNKRAALDDLASLPQDKASYNAENKNV